MFGLEQKLLDEIVRIVRRRKEPEKIVLYGSRANGDYKKTSDIDIAIFGKDWSGADIAAVHLALEDEARTPLKFDVVNFYAVSKESLKQNIITKGKALYESPGMKSEEERGNESGKA